MRIESVSGGQRVYFNCDYCGEESHDKLSQYKKKRRHYCNEVCYSSDRKENWKPYEQPTWTGGVSDYEAHKRWKAKNPERMAHLKARQYARKKNAEGQHTFEQWEELIKKHGGKCVSCGQRKDLTKDHIMPLSEGGSDYIFNIQPMCRSCNSRKWKFIHENLELLKGDGGVV